MYIYIYVYIYTRIYIYIHILYIYIIYICVCEPSAGPPAIERWLPARESRREKGRRRRIEESERKTKTKL